MDVKVPHSCTAIALGSSVPWTGGEELKAGAEQPATIKDKAKVEFRMVAPQVMQVRNLSPRLWEMKSWFAQTRRATVLLCNSQLTRSPRRKSTQCDIQ
jgi:hypothetical protein